MHFTVTQAESCDKVKLLLFLITFSLLFSLLWCIQQFLLGRYGCRAMNVDGKILKTFLFFCFLLLVSICNVFANGETSHRLELIKCSFLLSFASSRAPSGLPSIADGKFTISRVSENTKQSRVSLESAVITLKKCHFMWKPFFLFCGMCDSTSEQSRFCTQLVGAGWSSVCVYMGCPRNTTAASEYQFALLTLANETEKQRRSVRAAHPKPKLRRNFPKDLHHVLCIESASLDRAACVARRRFAVIISLCSHEFIIITNNFL